MSKKYRIWLEVEIYDPKTDSYYSPTDERATAQESKAFDLPHCIGLFDTIGDTKQMIGDILWQPKKELAEEIAEYILYFEEDDFKFYCDEEERENHVYLKAYEYIYGPKAAETLLNEERGHK